jgi:hypothetical protein
MQSKSRFACLGVNLTSAMEEVDECLEGRILATLVVLFLFYRCLYDKRIACQKRREDETFCLTIV